MRKPSQRRILKKELARAVAYKNALPRLIDCSGVYGDDFFTEADYAKAEERIAEIKQQIADLPIHPDTIRQQNQTNTPLNGEIKDRYI